MTKFHSLNAGQWEYFTTIHELVNRHTANSQEHVIRIRPVIQKIYDHVSSQRKANVANYKSIRYTVIDDETFTFQ